MKFSSKVYLNDLERMMLEEVDVKYHEKRDENDEEAKNSQKISEFCNVILKFNPNDVYAILFSSLRTMEYKTLSTFFDIYPGQFKRIANAIELAKTQLGESEDYYDYCEFAFKEIGKSVNMGINVVYVCFAVNKLKLDELVKEANAGYGNQNTITEANKLKKTIEEWDSLLGHGPAAIDAVNEFYCKWLSEVDVETMPKSVISTIRSAYEENKKIFSYFQHISDASTLKVARMCDETLKRKHELAVEKYWQAHPEEKSGIEAQISEQEKEIERLGFVKNEVVKKQNEDIAAINGVIDEIRAEQESKKAEILSAISSLETEKASQGLFALKAKKQLSLQIEEKKQEFQNVVKQYDDKVYEQEEKINTVKRNADNEQKNIDRDIVTARGKISQMKDVLSNKEE